MLIIITNPDFSIATQLQPPPSVPITAPQPPAPRRRHLRPAAPDSSASYHASPSRSRRRDAPPPATMNPHPQPSAPSRRTPEPERGPLSERATVALVRRTLCPRPGRSGGRDPSPALQDLLPPLTSRNDVDLELYALLAILLRDLVQSWYAKLTTDESFVAELVHLVAHCTRALEQRLRKLDLALLLLDEMPRLLDRHITSEPPSPPPSPPPQCRASV